MTQVGRPMWMVPAAAAALVAFPAAARADFTTPQCFNSAALEPNNSIADVGSTLQKVAQNGTDNMADATG